MAGPTVLIAYVTDLDVAYAARVPAWQAAITGDGPPAGMFALPRGWRKRYRLIRDEVDGSEHRLYVGDRTSGSWTAPPGTVIGDAVTVPGRDPATFTFQGAIGERRTSRF